MNKLLVGVASMSLAAGTYGQTCGVWTQVDAGGPPFQTNRPPARWGHQLVWDQTRQRVCMTGGFMPFSGNTSEFLWEGTQWIQNNTVSTPPLALHGAAYDVAHRRVIIFGGINASGSATNQMIEIDSVSGIATSRTASNGPAARYLPAMTYDASRGRVVMFGGISSDGQVLADSWEWNGVAWTPRIGGASSVPPIAAHRIVIDPTSSFGVGFGGFNPDGQEVQSWYRIAGGLYTEVGPIPSNLLARQGHVMAWDPIRRLALMAGGENAGVRLGDTWEWTPSPVVGLPGTWALRTLNGLTPRSYASMAFDELHQQMVVFGGVTDDGTKNDTWLFGTAPAFTISEFSLPYVFFIGQPLVASVQVVGPSAVAYQWFYNGVPIPGATDAVYRIETAQASHTGDYSVSISDGCRTVTVGPRHVTVRPCIADVCGIGGPPAPPDGLVTGDDFIAFINAYVSRCGE